MTALGTRIREGTTTSEAITSACLEHIAQINPRLNAFITVLGDRALAEARQADHEIRAGHDRGPLHGVPLSLKDLIDLAGTPTTAASQVRQGSIARHDAPVVAHLKLAGAVMIGKCNLHEFAYGTTSDESAFGPVRHPLDPTRAAGGSSGGSAVAVATGMCAGSVGTDTGGSIRIPSALCGLAGLKPGYREVSSAGVIPLSWSLDHVGPIAGCVDDAWMLFNAMRGDQPPVLHDRPSTLHCRLGIPRAYFLDVLDDEVRARFSETVSRLRAAGANVEDVWIPHAADTAPVYLHIAAPEAAAYHAMAIERHPEAYTPNVRLRLEAGRYLLAEDYVRAQRGREVLRREVDAALRGCDALLLPTVAIPPPAIGATEVEIAGRKESVRSIMLRLTQLFNLTGHPAISLPAGATSQGFPCGIQLVGALGDTQQLLELARACERQVRVEAPGTRNEV
jgi:aspartyl-tRNA(Asn)/glutamyl-tRNA(Gln) amidotransferase subunit A